MVICFLADARSINTINWARHLASKHEIHVLSFSMQEIPNVNVHKITCCRKLGKLGYLTALPQVKKLLSRICPDIVNAYFITSYGLLGTLSGFRPLVLTAAGSDVFGGYLLSRNRMVRYLMRILIGSILRKASLILAWTDLMAERLEALGAIRNSIFCIPRGVNLKLFSPNRNRNLVRSNKIRIIHTRSLKAVYRVASVIRVIKHIKNKGYDVELYLVGDGPMKSQLKSLVVLFDLREQVKFLGKVDYEKLPELLRRRDFYISLPLSDGASSSLFEAMACRLYPILSNIGSNQIWVKNNENGILVDANDIQMIADKIIGIYEDSAAFEKAVERNTKIVNNKLSWELNMKTIESKIRQCYLESL